MSKTTKSSIDSREHQVLNEDIHEAEARKVIARVNFAFANAGKMEELERKLSEAGEKIREAAERVGDKVTQRFP